MTEIKDLAKLTERALRDLAQKVVGPQAASLRTRSDLVEALTRALGTKGAGSRDAWTQGPGRPDRADEPRPEGHMVARVAGEGAAHAAPHPLTEDRLEPPAEIAPGWKPEPLFDEDLGDLPDGYGDDALVALPRDPTTLWCYWDFAHHTVQEAMRDLENPHARLRLLEQGRVVRELDFALESRSFYLSDLTPGRHYRVEVLFYGTNGRHKRVGRPSNSVMLPPRGPSSIIDDRFMTLPWGTPLSRRFDLFDRARPESGFSGEDRDAFREASAGRGLGASENRPNAPGVPGGGLRTGRPWSGTRYDGA